MSMASELAIETLIYGNQWRWLYEDAGGHWQLTAASQGWRDDLDGITVVIRYARSFVLGGFLEAPTGATLEIAPQLPNRDWDSKDGQEIVTTSI